MKKDWLKMSQDERLLSLSKADIDLTLAAEGEIEHAKLLKQIAQAKKRQANRKGVKMATKKRSRKHKASHATHGKKRRQAKKAHKKHHVKRARKGKKRAGKKMRYFTSKSGRTYCLAEC